MNVPELAREFDVVGLDEDEARVYLRLLQAGSAKVSQLMVFFDVSRSSLYRVLDDLAERGFVSKSLEQPTVYRPRDPEVIFENSYEELESRLDQVETARERVMEDLEDVAGAELDVPGSHWKRVEGIARIYEVIKQEIRETESEFCGVSNNAVTQHTSMPVVRETWRLVSERANGDLNVRLLLGFDDPLAPLPSSSDAAGIEARRFSPPHTLHFLLFDGSRILTMVRPQGSTDATVEPVALWTDACGIVDSHELLFDRMWPEAKPV